MWSRPGPAPCRFRRAAARPVPASGRCADAGWAGSMRAAPPRAATGRPPNGRRRSSSPLRRRTGRGAELGDVEIDLQNPLLGQHGIDPDRERKFQRLADVAWALPKEQVFRHLLGDGGSAAHPLAFLGVAHRLAQRAKINAMMLAEMRVLRAHHRARQIGRHRVKVDPLPRQRRARKLAPEHQCRDRMAGAVKRRQHIGHEERDQHDQGQGFEGAQIGLFCFGPGRGDTG